MRDLGPIWVVGAVVGCLSGCTMRSESVGAAIRRAEAPPPDHFALDPAPTGRDPPAPMARSKPAPTPEYLCNGRPAVECSEEELEGTFKPAPSVTKPVRSGSAGSRGAAPAMSCELRREQLARVSTMYEESRVADAEYAAKHCQRTTKTAVNVVTGARGAPDRAWNCGGHLVDAPVSVRTMALEARVSEIKVWVREHCDATR